MLMYVSFRSHPTMVKLLQKLGVDLGGSEGLHAHRNSPPLLMRAVSKDIHSAVLAYIYQSKTPFSLMIDSSVDTSGEDEVGLLLQIIINNRPEVVFYKMIPLGIDHTAEGYLFLLKRAMEEDIIVEADPNKKTPRKTFFDIAKEQMVGMSSDSAAVFSGNHKGLGVILSKALKDGNANGLFRSFCVAHKLNLAVRDLVPKTQELDEFEDSIKSIAHFYNNVNAKNLAHLTATAQTTGTKARRLTYAFTTRWAVAEDLVLARLREMLPILIIDLEAIANPNSDFNPDTRLKATGLLNTVTSREFVIMVFLVSDLIGIVATFSRILQRAGSTVIGVYSIKQELIAALEHIRDNETGKHLAILLSELECRARDTSTSFNPCTGWRQVFSSVGVRFKRTDKYGTLDLSDRRRGGATNIRPPATLIPQMIGDLIDDINKYFPEAEVMDFEAMVPKNLNIGQMKSGQYALNEIARIARRLQPAKQVETLDEWIALTKIMAESDMLETLMTKDDMKSPEKFWPAVLKHFGGNMGRNIKGLIRTLLVIPNNSAPVERLYSIMNHLKNSRRSRMSAKTLNDVLRVLWNTPGDISLFPYYKYGKKWQGYHVSRRGKRPGRRPNAESGEGDGPSSSKRLLLENPDEVPVEVEEETIRQEQLNARMENELFDDGDQMVEMGGNFDDEIIEGGFNVFQLPLAL